jgi:hypothetical protein
MARITTEYISNFDESKEPNEISNKGRDKHWPAIAKHSGVEGPVELRTIEDEQLPPEHVLDFPSDVAEPDALDRQDAQEEGESSSAGTSSSTSGSKPDKSGSSAPATGSSSPSPAQSAASPSSQDRPAPPASPSTAASTSGSTPATGSGPAHPQASSATTGAGQGTAPTQKTASEEDPSSGGFVAPGT